MRRRLECSSGEEERETGDFHRLFLIFYIAGVVVDSPLSSSLLYNYLKSVVHLSTETSNLSDSWTSIGPGVFRPLTLMSVSGPAEGPGPSTPTCQETRLPGFPENWIPMVQDVFCSHVPPSPQVPL